MIPMIVNGGFHYILSINKNEKTSTIITFIHIDQEKKKLCENSKEYKDGNKEVKKVQRETYY